MSAATVEPTRHPLEQARGLAIELAELLAPACVRVELAGSIRRNKPDVGDIELVCLPKLVLKQPIDLNPPSLFPALSRAVAAPVKWPATEDRVIELVAATGIDLTFNRINKANGQRLKRLVYGGLPVDLFCVLSPAQWGVIFALRTGPRDFSHALVTQKSKGGLCPDNCRVLNGQLWWEGNATECLDERAFFAKLGLPWIEPIDRTGAMLARLLRRR